MAGQISTNAFSEIVGAIYDCAIDPALWPETLALIRGELGFCQATLTLIAVQSGDLRLNVTSGIEQIWLDRMPLYGTAIIEQWGGKEGVWKNPVGEPILLSRVNPTAHDSGRARDYYLEWRKPQGLIDTMNLTLARDTEMLGVVSLGRHEKLGSISEREMDLMRLLAPHLQRAAQISRLLDIKTIAAATFESALDALSAAVLLVDRDMRLVHANQAGQALIARGAPLSCHRDRLRAGAQGATAALAVAVAQAADNESALGRKGMDIPARGIDDEPFALHVMPLRHRTLRPGVAPSVVAAIFVSPAFAPPPATTEIVSALFGLTPAESKVFELFAAGCTPTNAARRLGVGQNTIKTHRARIFDKTGIHRQADLVALAASFVTPVRNTESTPDPANQDRLGLEPISFGTFD